MVELNFVHCCVPYYSYIYCSGVSIHGKIRGEVLVYSIGARKDDKRSVSWCSGFDPKVEHNLQEAYLIGRFIDS